MGLRLVLEAIIYTLLYSAFIVVLVKRQGVIKQLVLVNICVGMRIVDNFEH